MKNSFTKLFGLTEKNEHEQIRHIPVDLIIASPYQPRTVFDDERIEELARTIKTHGIIQPIVVREKDGKYEIIAGERRWRAARKIGLETIPAIVKDLNDSQTASIALIENLQRENLTSIEEAMAYQQLMEIHHLTQESLAQRLGKSQSTIANKIRLLQLSEPVKQSLLERKISERHARALLALESEELQLKVLNEIISKDLNVKQTEARVQLLKEKNKPAPKSRRISFSKDIRLALNTIKQSVDLIASSGIPIEVSEQDRPDFYEVVLKIPKRPR